MDKLHWSIFLSIILETIFVSLLFEREHFRDNKQINRSSILHRSKAIDSCVYSGKVMSSDVIQNYDLHTKQVSDLLIIRFMSEFAQILASVYIQTLNISEP